LRQDRLTLQLLSVMDRLWKEEEGLDLRLNGQAHDMFAQIFRLRIFSTKYNICFDFLKFSTLMKKDYFDQFGFFFSIEKLW
jgi:hypothetical protein